MCGSMRADLWRGSAARSRDSMRRRDPVHARWQARFSAQGESLEVRFDSPTDTPGDPPPAAAAGAPAESVCAAALADLAPLGANAT